MCIFTGESHRHTEYEKRELTQSQMMTQFPSLSDLSVYICGILRMFWTRLSCTGMGQGVYTKQEEPWPLPF